MYNSDPRKNLCGQLKKYQAGYNLGSFVKNMAQATLHRLFKQVRVIMVLQPDLLFGAEVVCWTVLHLRPDKQDNHDDNEDLDDDGDDEDNEILDDIVAKIMIILILMMVTRILKFLILMAVTRTMKFLRLIMAKIMIILILMIITRCSASAF